MDLSDGMRMSKKSLMSVVGLVALLIPMTADAGDTKHGAQLAQGRCAACHIVGRWQGDVFADAPPFEVIARKFSADGEDLIAILRRPHRKMNFRPSQSEADDIATYIRSMVR
jgi:mono/diheme cytochrome c family protein